MDIKALQQGDHAAWRALHADLRHFLHLPVGLKYTHETPPFVDYGEMLNDSPWNYGSCNVFATGIVEWIHDADHARQVVLHRPYYRHGKTAPSHTLVHYRTARSSIYFDAAVIGFSKQEYLKLIVDYYWGRQRTAAKTRKELRLQPSDIKDAAYMADMFAACPNAAKIEELVASLNLAIGRWPKKKTPPTHWEEYGGSGNLRGFDGAFDPTGALVGRYKVGGLRIVVYRAAGVQQYRVVLYYQHTAGVLKPIHHATVGPALGPKDAARMGIRAAVAAGKIRNVADDIHVKLQLDEW